MSFDPDYWDADENQIDEDLGFPDAEDWKEYIYPSSHQILQEEKEELNKKNNDDEDDGN